MGDKIKVCLMVSGFPSEDNPTHGLFNKRAAIALAPMVDLTVVQYRLWKPGRKRLQVNTENGYKLVVVCVPFIPVYPNTFSTFNTLLMSYFSKSLLREMLKKTDILHVVNATLAFIPALWKKNGNFKLLVQSIGSDLNSEFPVIIHQPCVKWFKQAIDAATFNSKQLSDQYNKLMGKAPVDKVIYRGVDLNVFSNDSKSGIKENTSITFLYIGGLPGYRNFKYKENTKGGHTLMNAWKQFEQGDQGERDVKLIFAGPDSLKSISVNWQKELKYPYKVEMPGVLNKEDLLKAYKNADVVLIPSMEEGLPNAGMEAAACKCAIIGTNVGGIPEIIIDKQTGFLIEAGDEKGLVNAIEHYVKDPLLCAHHGMQGRILMEKKFNHQEFAPAYLKLYQQLLIPAV